MFTWSTLSWYNYLNAINPDTKDDLDSQDYPPCQPRAWHFPSSTFACFVLPQFALPSLYILSSFSLLFKSKQETLIDFLYWLYFVAILVSFPFSILQATENVGRKHRLWLCVHEVRTSLLPGVPLIVVTIHRIGHGGHPLVLNWDPGCPCPTQLTSWSTGSGRGQPPSPSSVGLVLAVIWLGSE